MPAGLQVYGPDGSLRVDLSTRIPRFLGTYFVSAGASGSIVNDGLLTGEPQCFCSMNATGIAFWPGDDLLPPTISFVGDTLYYSDVRSPQRLMLWVF
jgi:hypothetical protein